MKEFKSYFILITCIAFSNLLIAQTFVSTVAENKNVVLEEFTGISCTYCPDGHRIAKDIFNQNPNDVVLINIHTGSFATPQGLGTDFRTSFGSAIDAQANVSGYPAGTVNRHQFSMTQNGGTAMSRGDWTSASSQILTEPSYINIEAQASIDVSTRLLTVVVEAYYTGNAPAGILNNVNVALLQNNIEGPQTGGSQFNPSAILPNGNYNHQHMLRHLVTGQWGETIMNPSGFWTNTYTYNIPNDLNSVVYDLFNLEVAVFVAEGQQEIINGNLASLSFITPPGMNLVDLSSNSNMSMPVSYCDNSITPEITVSNNSQLTVDTFEVSYTLNSNQAVSQTVYDPSFIAGATTTVSFPTITVPSGNNTISYNVSTVSGTSFIDNVSNNNSFSLGSFNTLSPTAFANTRSEGFDNYALATPAPTNAILEEQNGNWVGVIDPTYTNGQPVGGFGNTPNAYRWRFGDFNNGEEAILVFDMLDFSSSTNNEISLSYSHANANSWDQDKLQILASTDCGISWDLVHEISGGDLHTASNLVSSGNFYPTASEWDSITVNLSNYDGYNNVNIAIKAIKGGGNNVYVDDINIKQGFVATSINQTTKENISVFPNPADEKINISGNYELLEIYDVFGKVVHTETNNTKSIDLKNISNGNYIIHFYSKDNNISTRKISIIK